MVRSVILVCLVSPGLAVAPGAFAGGSFTSSDPMLNQVWQQSVQTAEDMLSTGAQTTDVLGRPCAISLPVPIIEDGLEARPVPVHRRRIGDRPDLRREQPAPRHPAGDARRVRGQPAPGRGHPLVSIPRLVVGVVRLQRLLDRDASQLRALLGRRRLREADVACDGAADRRLVRGPHASERAARERPRAVRLCLHQASGERRRLFQRGVRLGAQAGGAVGRMGW